MSFTTAHSWIGYAIVGSWAIVAGWGFALALLRIDETPMFWRGVVLAQILLGVQFVAGVTLLALGRLPVAGDWFTNIFHVLYGVGFPVVVLVFAHRWSRAGRARPQLIFGVAGVVLFGLTARAWMTGAGG